MESVESCHITPIRSILKCTIQTDYIEQSNGIVMYMIK